MENTNDKQLIDHTLNISIEFGNAEPKAEEIMIKLLNSKCLPLFAEREVGEIKFYDIDGFSDRV